jgi:hypothetical protein
MMMRHPNLSRRNLTIASLTALSLVYLVPSLVHNVRLAMAQGVWCSLSHGDQLDSPRMIHYGKDCP